MHIEPITWRLDSPKKPKDFPCVVCKERMAEFKASLFALSEDPPVQITMALCPDCVGKGEDSIRLWLKERRKNV